MFSWVLNASLKCSLKTVLVNVNMFTVDLLLLIILFCSFILQPPKRVLTRRCSENTQQIYRRTPMLKCDFSEFAKQLY